MTHPSSRSMRHAARLTVAILVTLMIALSARPARAAPPEVKASENPVAFACPARQGTTKVITLTWSVIQGTQLPSLVVTEGAQTVLSQQFITPPSSGAVPLTVAYGKTYVAQLKDVLSQPLGPPLVITTSCADRPGGSGGSNTTLGSASGSLPPISTCTAGCTGVMYINNKVTVTPDPHGTYVTFAISALNESSFELELRKKVNGQCGPFVAGTAGPKAHTWNPPIFDLDAGTPYCYTVIAKDAQGPTTAQGEFSTRARRVKVNFAHIWVTGAEEDIFSGDPDPIFFWRINGACVGASDYWASGIAVLDSKDPNFEVTINNAPATLTLGVLGVDDDSFGSGHPFTTVCGDNAKDFSDWSSATGSYYVGWTMVDPTEEFQKNFLLNANNGTFKFQITGTYTVTYP